MKLTNIIVVVLLIALCALGWFTMISGNTSQGTEYEAAIQQAEYCMERGLYQRAIESYRSTLQSKNDENIYLDIANAYSLRFAEAPEDTFDDYLAFVKEALNAFPGNRTLVDHLVSLCTEKDPGQTDYKTLYPYLKKAVANGCDDESTLALYTRARYDYSLRRNNFKRLVDVGSEKYAALTERGWNIYIMAEGFQLSSNWDYVGPVSGSGITVFTGEDSRIFDSTNNMVLGIFQTPVTAAGVFSEGLIPVLVSGTYGYYDSYADHIFGSYDYAGTFQNGLAAVETDGKWMLVDTQGEIVRDGFDQIVTDLSGRYMANDTIVVKESGTYAIYDAKWNRRANLVCDEVDILSADGIIAFRKGEKWGFADTAGNVIIEPQYTGAHSFSNGLAAVQNSNGQWGFISGSGRLVIDYAFADAGYMSSAGVCPVRVDTPPDEPLYDPNTGDDIPQSETWAFLSLTNGLT